MTTRRQAVLACAASLTGFVSKSTAGSRDLVRVSRVPGGGLQPQVAIDEQGTLHLLDYVGDPQQGDLLYYKSTNGGLTFSRAIRVNSQPGSAIAVGTIRGAQLAVGKDGRVHVSWNGSADATPEGPLNPDSGKPGMPMLYTRLNDAGTAFEPQRNLMRHSFGLDGGGSIAADRFRNVYVAWHGVDQAEASGTGKEGEARRRLWIAKSQDEGHSFSPEEKAWSQETGACGCCGMKIFVDHRANIYALYRSATESVHRDVYILTSQNQGQRFEGRLLHKWEINACPMSSMDIAENAGKVIGAWETGGQVFWTRLDGGGQPISPAGEGKGRKHPRLAVNQSGDVLLAWNEGTGWKKGGSLAYQVYDRTGWPTRDGGRLPGISAWSFAAVIATPDNRFSILY